MATAARCAQHRIIGVSEFPYISPPLAGTQPETAAAAIGRQSRRVDFHLTDSDPLGPFRIDPL